MKLPLRYYGDPILRQKAKPVEKITPEIVQLAEDMIESMTAYGNAIGFAANQLGQLFRIFVIREEKAHSDGTYSFAPPEVFINPVISQPSQEIEVMEEGCMSLPKLTCSVPRPHKIRISYQNLKGERMEEEVEGFRARMLMHENDHLNGVLIIDRTDPKERKKLEAELQSIKKKYTIS
jgi:peptide deformylase